MKQAFRSIAGASFLFLLVSPAGAQQSSPPAAAPPTAAPPTAEDGDEEPPPAADAQESASNDASAEPAASQESSDDASDPAAESPASEASAPAGEGATSPEASAPAGEGAASPVAVPPADAVPEAAPEPASVPGEHKGSGAPDREGASNSDDYQGSKPAEAAPASEKSFRRFQFGIMLDFTLPLGQTADFVSGVSIQGFSLDARYFVTDKFGVGASVGFDTLSKKDEGTFEWDNVTGSGVHTRELSFTPLLGKLIYTHRGASAWTPYAALGMGATRTASRVFAGISGMSRAGWQFSAVPELGVSFQVSKARGIANLRLNYLTKTDKNTSHMFLNLSVGVAIQ